MSRRRAARIGSIERRLRRISPSDWLRAAVIGCAALAILLLLLAHALSPATGQAQARIGQPAPSFSLPAAQREQILPQSVNFSGHAARPTLLVFFNTLCVHCVAGVQAAHAASMAGPLTPSGASVNIIYIDAPGENAEITGQYMTRLGLDAPVLLDHDARIASRYGVAYYPTIVLVDTHGGIRAVWVGAPTASQLSAAIARVA